MCVKKMPSIMNGIREEDACLVSMCEIYGTRAEFEDRVMPFFHDIDPRGWRIVSFKEPVGGRYGMV